MRYLLDTHTFLWFVWDSPLLSAPARLLIEEPTNEVLLSIASVWEVAIKAGYGKLTLTQPVQTFFEQQLARNQIRLLPIELSHAARVATLPPHHRDPFDRVLVAQCLTESLTLISVDTILDSYGLDRRW